MKHLLPWLLALVPACSLFTDLSGFTGGPDGGVDPRESGAADAIAPPIDGGLDGDATSLPSHGCASKVAPDFCEDFDGLDPIASGGSRWTAVHADITVDTIFSLSAPHGARIPVKTANDCAFVDLEKQVNGTFASGRVELAIRPQEPSSFVTLSFNVSQTVSYLLIAALESGNKIAIQAQRYDGTPTSFGVKETISASPLVGNWNQATLAFQSSPRRATLTIGDAVASLDLPAEFDFTNPDVVVGAWCEGVKNDLSVDDVAFWMTP